MTADLKARCIQLVETFDNRIFTAFDDMPELSSALCEELAVAAREAMLAVLERETVR